MYQRLILTTGFTATATASGFDAPSMPLGCPLLFHPLRWVFFAPPLRRPFDGACMGHQSPFDGACSCANGFRRKNAAAGEAKSVVMVFVERREERVFGQRVIKSLHPLYALVSGLKMVRDLEARHLVHPHKTGAVVI